MAGYRVMSFISIEVDGKTLDEVKFMLATVKNGAERAIIQASNRTAITARSRVVKTTASRLNLLQKRIKEETRVIPTKSASIGARVQISRKAIPLIDFPHLESFIGVSVAVRRSGPDRVYKHRFISQMRSGHVGIFERRLRSSGVPVGRLKIDEKAGPSIGMVFHFEDEKKLFDEMMLLFQQRVIARAENLLRRA
jgi:hypothetical protein